MTAGAGPLSEMSNCEQIVEGDARPSLAEGEANGSEAVGVAYLRMPVLRLHNVEGIESEEQFVDTVSLLDSGAVDLFSGTARHPGSQQSTSLGLLDGPRTSRHSELRGTSQSRTPVVPSEAQLFFPPLTP